MIFREYLNESSVNLRESGSDAFTEYKEYDDMVKFAEASLKKLKLKYIPYKLVYEGSEIVFGTENFQIDGIPSITFYERKKDISMSSTNLEKKNIKLFGNIILEIAEKSDMIFDVLSKQKELERKLTRAMG